MAAKVVGRGGGWIGLGLDEAEGGGEAATANRSRCRNGRWRRERGGLTQRRGVVDRLPGGGRVFVRLGTVWMHVDAYGQMAKVSCGGRAREESSTYIQSQLQ